MASGSLRFLSCSTCGTVLAADAGPLANRTCPKCGEPVQANGLRYRSGSSRSGNLGWSSRSSSRHEQAEDDAAADGRKTPETESRHGAGGFLPPLPRRSVAGSEDKAENNLSQFESTMDRIAVHTERSLVLGSDSEASRSLHRSRQPLFSSSQSVISSEDSMGDDNSSWNGDYPGSPHSGDSGSYEPSCISSEDAGYLSRSGGVSRRTRRTNRLRNQQAGKPPVVTPGRELGSFGGSADIDASDTSRELAHKWFFQGFQPPRGHMNSDTSGSLGGSSSNGMHAREPSSSSSWGSGDLSRYNAWTGSVNDVHHSYGSSSGDLSRLASLRGAGHINDPQQVQSCQLNSNGSKGRAPLVGLREVNPYGSPSPQASPGTHMPSPEPSSHYKQQSPSASRSIHCCMHCRSKACGVFEQFSAEHLCCTNGDCSYCSHSCCQPPTSANSGQQLQCHGKPNPFIPLATPNADLHIQIPGQALKAKEKKKLYVRPVFGGAGFLMCYICDEIVQVPKDFHFSRRRRNRMRCGNCNEVVEYMLVEKTRILPYQHAVNNKIANSAAGGGASWDGGNEGVDGRTRGQNSHAASPAFGDGSNHSRRDQISNNENYSGYSDGGGAGGSTEGEGESTQSRKAMRKREVAVLHRLMGYFSARDIMYQADA